MSIDCALTKFASSVGAKLLIDLSEPGIFRSSGACYLIARGSYKTFGSSRAKAHSNAPHARATATPVRRTADR